MTRWPAPAAPGPSVLGTASDTTSVARPSATTPKARCRRQPGPLGHERAEQRHVGEPRRVGLPAQLQHHVEGDQRGDDEQREQPQRGLEGHREAPPLPARRRSATKRTTSISQSRSVRSCRCPAPARRSAAAIAARWAAAPVGEPRAELGVAASAPRGSGRVSGSTTVSRPDVGQLQLARVDDLDRPAGRAGPTARAAAAPSRCRRGSRRRRRPARAGAAGRRSVSSAAARSPRRPPVRPRGRDHRAQQPLGGQPPGHGRVAVDPLAGGDDGAEPVAAVHGEVPDRGEPGDRQVALLAVGGAEVEAGREVDDRPGLQLAVGDRLADVRHLGAGGDRPVHPPDVVPGVVRAGVAGLATRSPGRARGGRPAAARRAGAGR